jgi:adenylate cyclase
MGRDERGTLAALKAIRLEVVDPAIVSLGGRIVKTTGDGLLLEFPSVVNAVRCAVEQTAMADRTAGIAEDRRIAFRVGINIGDIIVEGDDIFGDGGKPESLLRVPRRMHWLLWLLGDLHDRGEALGQVDR